MCPWPTLIVAAIATGVCICLSIVFTTDRSKLLITKFGTLEKAHRSHMLGGQISENHETSTLLGSINGCCIFATDE